MRLSAGFDWVEMNRLLNDCHKGRAFDNKSIEAQASTGLIVEIFVAPFPDLQETCMAPY